MREEGSKLNGSRVGMAWCTRGSSFDDGAVRSSKEERLHHRKWTDETAEDRVRESEVCSGICSMSAMEILPAEDGIAFYWPGKCGR